MPKEMRARTKKRTMMMIAIVSFSLTILAVCLFLVVVVGGWNELWNGSGDIASFGASETSISLFRSLGGEHSMHWNAEYRAGSGRSCLGAFLFVRTRDSSHIKGGADGERV